MKVLFVASLGGKPKYTKHYQTIVGFCRKLNHDVYDDYVFKRSAKDSFTPEQQEHEYQKLVQTLKKIDVLIAEVTHSSTTVGVFILLALQNYKPTLALTQETYHGLIVGDPHRLLQIKNYSPDNLACILDKFLTFAERRRLSKRFNMMIDETIDEFLTQQSKKLSISKSSYLRQLIQQEMNKHTP